MSTPLVAKMQWPFVTSLHLHCKHMKAISKDGMSEISFDQLDEPFSRRI